MNPTTVESNQLTDILGLRASGLFPAGKEPSVRTLREWTRLRRIPHHRVGHFVYYDLVLFEDEVNPVMTAALEAGLSVTALHNHFFFEQPRVYFMHVGGEGTVAVLAAGVKAALAKQKEIRAAQPQAARTFGAAFMPGKNAITGATIDAALHTHGQANAGMFKIVLGRTTKMPCGCDMTKEMGVNTWAAFAGTDDNAVVDGDFAVLEDELQPVLKSLRSAGINIVAIHSHMTHENPRVLFLHYWGKGSVGTLTHALKAALEVQKAVPPSGETR